MELPSPAAILGQPLAGVVMGKLDRYAYTEAAWFLAACCLMGCGLGILVRLLW